MTRAFWALWGFDALIAAVFVAFFFIGLADGSVSSFNIGLWIAVLGGLAAVLLAGLRLRAAGHLRAAAGVLLVLAGPGLLIALFFVVAIVAHPRWN